MSFTPGPWKVEGRLISDKSGAYILEAYLPYDKPEDEARAEMATNLRLAAAAPEMYKLLRGELLDGDAGVLSFEREAKIRAIFEQIEGGPE